MKSLTHTTQDGIKLTIPSVGNLDKMPESTSAKLVETLNTLQSNLKSDIITEIVFGCGDADDVSLKSGGHAIYVSPEFTGVNNQGWLYIYDNVETALDCQETMMETGQYEQGLFNDLIKFTIEG